MSRREALRGSILGLVVVATGSACRTAAKGPSCTDTSKLSPEDARSRTTLGYVDASTEAGKDCSGCTQFLPAPAAEQCGECKVLKGPIHPKGYCRVFAPKA